MNDNHTRDEILGDPQTHFPWLEGEEAGKAHDLIETAITSCVGVDLLRSLGEDTASALATWILEDLAVAGLEIVRRDA